MCIRDRYSAWQAAGSAMQSSIALEMLSRSVELGPFPETFTIRDGALAYAPFDLDREPDGVVMNGSVLAAPVDEYNAPVGAALCETPVPMFPAAAIPGTEGINPYLSLIHISEPTRLLSISYAVFCLKKKKI